MFLVQIDFSIVLVKLFENHKHVENTKITHHLINRRGLDP